MHITNQQVLKYGNKQRTITHSCGTGGTISGTAKYLKDRIPISKSLVDAFGSAKKSTMKPESLIVMRFIHTLGLGKNLIPSTDF
jgi:cysteine synthase